MTAFKTLLFLIIVPGTIAGWVPYWLSRWRSGLPELELGAWGHVGWLFLVPGVAVQLWSMIEFVVEGRGTPAPIDPPQHFVATVRGIQETLEPTRGCLPTSKHAMPTHPSPKAGR